MEFYLVMKELLFHQHFFYWYIPFASWSIPVCYRVFFGDGLFFWQEVEIDDSILDYEGLVFVHPTFENAPQSETARVVATCK